MRNGWQVLQRCGMKAVPEVGDVAQYLEQVGPCWGWGLDMCCTYVASLLHQHHHSRAALLRLSADLFAHAVQFTWQQAYCLKPHHYALVVLG